VDDNTSSRAMLTETLAGWSMKPDSVETGAAGLEALEIAARSGEPFGLALIDRCMPEMDGLTMIERIRQKPELCDLRILILTSAGDALLSRQAGANAHLLKPIRQSDLLRTISSVLAVRPGGRVEGSSPLPPQPLRESKPGLRILVAEDNTVNQRVATRLLEGQGHSVAIANDGVQALAALEREAFELILMDVQMPRMDGFEATAAIRNREKERGIRTPIIAVTAHAMKGDIERCLQAGMDAYISKPIHIRELNNAIEALTPAAERRS